MSWKTGCYIHGGLSRTEFRLTGPDVIPLLESLSVNSFAKYPVGSLKHGIMCMENGLISTHAVLQRNAEDDVRMYAAGGWAVYQAQKGNFRVKGEPWPGYLFQVAGPTSLQTLERATGEPLDDIAFLRFRHAKIAGKTVEIARIGMSGNLAYEVRGPVEEGADVYETIYRAGQDLGIQRLGWRTYLVNHVEGGFPQQTWTFVTASNDDPGYVAFLGDNAMPVQVTGSVDPANMRARYRTPVEVGWTKTVKFDHEFIGRKALEAEVANPRRTVATLRWNPDDVVDIYASLLKRGEEYKTIDLPTAPSWQNGALAHADYILKDGREVGYSSGTIYSYYFREVLSMACIDIDLAEIGTEVTVQWGDHGKRIKTVRAKVDRFPYLNEGRNNRLDTRQPVVAE